VRQPDGIVNQYGRVPESGREIYFSRYRYGGGVRGNLPPNALQIMNSSVAYIARVNNLERAIGGQDQESMQEVQLRAQREMQAQKRAVTAGDFEQFVKRFSLAVSRVKCMVPKAQDGLQETGAIEVLVIPAVAEALQAGDLTSLHLKPEFVTDLHEYLEQYRLLTTIVQITEPKYIGIKLNIQVVISDYSNPERVIARINRAVQNLINPLPPFPQDEEIMSLLEPGWEGWPWGRNLYPAEIYALIQRVPGVKYAIDVAVSYRQVRPSREKRAESAALTVLEDKALWVAADTLLCSLDHEITFQTLSEFERQKAT
jgi:predicted phage baseplate assembly protein